MRVSNSLVALGGGLLIVSSTSAAASSSPNALGPFACGRRRRVAGICGPHLAFASVSSDVVDKAKNRVLSLASNVSQDSKTGVFIADPEVKSDLKTAVADLEAVCGNPTDRERQLMIGDWTLLCTTNSANGRGADNDNSIKKGPKKLPFKLPELPFQNKLTKSIAVTQRIRCMDEDAVGGAKVVDRVDNVIEFTPFADTVGDLLGDGMPFAALKDLKLNPLEVKKSKVTLIHKAEVQSVTPVLRTKINLQSYVLTVAGTSQYLEPEGADLLGLNAPLGEFQSGMFDTTYVDEELRISRGKVGMVDVLRVFVRKGIDAEVGALVDEDAIAGSTSDDNEGAEGSEKPNKLEEVRTAVEGVADAVRKVNEDVVETIKGDMDDVVEAVEGIADAVIGKENREMIENEIKGEIKNVEDFVEDVEESINEVRDAAQNVTKAVQKVTDDVSDAVKEDVDDVVEAVEGVADAVIGKESREMIEKEIEGEIKSVQETVEDVQDAIKEVQSDVEEQLGINQEANDEVSSESESGGGEESTGTGKEDDSASS